MVFGKVFVRGMWEVSTEMFTAVWLFNLWTAYKVYQSKDWRVFISVLFLFSLACRIASVLSGDGILWR